MERDLAALAAREFDVLVVGGGIVGACLAWDASLRGMEVALVEEADFCSGASWNSLKIVHGGLRYLQSADFRRARASILERRHWLRVAPHLVQPLRVLVPDRGDISSNRFAIRAAAAVADTIGFDRNRGVIPERRLPTGSILGPEEAAAFVPPAVGKGINGAAVFWDGLLYSSERLVLSLIGAVYENGGTVANYARCLRGVAGDLPSAEIEDAWSGERWTTRAATIIDTTGSDALSLGRVPATPAPRAGAINVIVPGRSCTAAFTLQVSPRADAGGSRRLFAVPWRGRLMVGTHYFHLTGEDEAQQLERETARFLDQITGAGLEVERANVLVRHFGRLPIAKGARSPADLLDRPLIIDHGRSGYPGFVSVQAVKLTTARRVAETVLDRVTAARDRTPEGGTAGYPVPGGDIESLEQLQREIGKQAPELSADVHQHLTHWYGTRYREVLDYRDRFPNALERVEPGHPVLRAQFLHAAEREMVSTAEDIVFRRTELGAVGAGSANALEQARLALETVGRSPRSAGAATPE